MASQWKLQIITPNLNSHNLIQLNVTRITKEPDVKHFSCKLTMKKKNNPNEDSISIKLNPAAPATNINVEHIGNAIIDDELSIHTEFILFSNTFVTTTNKDTIFDRVDALKNYGDLLKSGDNSDFMIQVKMIE